MLEYQKEVIPTTNKESVVAIIKKEGEEMPFRVVCENFETVEDVKLAVADWIRTADDDDARAAADYEAELERRKLDAKLEELNSTVEEEVLTEEVAVTEEEIVN